MAICPPRRAWGPSTNSMTGGRAVIWGKRKPQGGLVNPGKSRSRGKGGYKKGKKRRLEVVGALLGGDEKNCEGETGNCDPSEELG